MSQTGNTIIVGASSGIGAALAMEWASQGQNLALIARREGELAATAKSIRARFPHVTVSTFVHDVAEVSTVVQVWTECLKTFGGRLDRVVYAAGIMPKVEPDEFSTSKDASMMAVNVVGAMAWLNLAATHFLTERSGQIVGISSVAGERGRIGAPAYNASKAALTSYLESLRNRLDRHGVSVVTVKPGFIATDMLKGVEKTFGVMSAEDCARVIVRRCDRRAQSFFVPWWWAWIGCAVRSIPSFIFRRLRV